VDEYANSCCQMLLLWIAGIAEPSNQSLKCSLCTEQRTATTRGYDRTALNNSDRNKDVVFALLSGNLISPVIAVERQTAKAMLLTELEQKGTRLTPENVLCIEKMPDGKIVFLESGSSKAGLQHIIERHGEEFAARGISNEEIPDFIMNTIKNGDILGAKEKVLQDLYM